MKSIYLFKRYERLWHWFQSLLIILLAVTGFSIHGTLRWGDFGAMIDRHEVLGLTLLVLTVFTMFWHATTGEGKQFLPTKKGLFDQIRFYTSGIFRKEPHPDIPSPESKFNPLQKVAYFSLLVFIFPVQMLTGLFLWALPRWEALHAFNPWLKPLGLVHTMGAFAMVVFIAVHLYMITTGHTFLSNLKGMITGSVEP